LIKKKKDGDHSNIKVEEIKDILKKNKKDNQSLVVNSGILKIKLISAEKLPALDITGASDPYFIFQIGKQILKSKGKNILIDY
jgi:Ca2+-dependent lipid-binding protein